MNGDTPAFPVSVGYMGDIEASGLTKREWFAGMADIPWNAVIETLIIQGNKKPSVPEVIEYRAKLKFIEADALLSAAKVEPR